ncbi:MAG: hypothetical protein R6U38_13130 [Desulfatiglandaceae bacterium]
MKTAIMKTTMGVMAVLLLLSTGAWRFLNPDLDLTVRFDRINGLQAGDRVLFEENHIGEVETIMYETDGSYAVEISIKSNFVNAATTLSEFYIVSDPQNRNSRAIEIVQTEPGGSVLEEGAVVEGSSRRSLLLRDLTKDIDKGLNYLKGEFEDLRKDIEDIPESDEYRELKRELEEAVKQLERGARESKEKIKQELLPLLIRELEELKEKIEEKGKGNPAPTSPETVQL